MNDRCHKCLINIKFCFCHKIKSVDINSKVDIIVHKSELRFTSNTAILSKSSLNHCDLHIKGIEGHPLSFDFIDIENYSPLYLYPSENSEVLTKKYLSQFSKPIQLIVPDGTWTQTKRFYKKEDSLHPIPRVRVETTHKSMYQLRRQVDESGLCTHEAIALALGLIEGKDIENSLLDNLKVMVNAHLLARKEPHYKLRYMYNSIPGISD